MIVFISKFFSIWTKLWIVRLNFRLEFLDKNWQKMALVRCTALPLATGWRNTIKPRALWIFKISSHPFWNVVNRNYLFLSPYTDKQTNITVHSSPLNYVKSLLRAIPVLTYTNVFQNQIIWGLCTWYFIALPTELNKQIVLLLALWMREKVHPRVLIRSH